MQRVTNCIYLQDGKVLLLKKPRRGWWAIPGGKMEPTETVKASVIREYREETGLNIEDPVLKGVYTFLVKKDDEIISEWMMFNFFCDQASGSQMTITEEGILEWHPIEEINNLPMAKGDYSIIKHAIYGKEVSFGTFIYDEENELLSMLVDS